MNLRPYLLTKRGALEHLVMKQRGLLGCPNANLTPLRWKNCYISFFHEWKIGGEVSARISDVLIKSILQQMLNIQALRINFSPCRTYVWSTSQHPSLHSYSNNSNNVYASPPSSLLSLSMVTQPQFTLQRLISSIAPLLTPSVSRTGYPQKPAKIKSEKPFISKLNN